MQVDGVSLPIVLDLLAMMYPVLAKVRYERLASVTGDRRLLVSSLLLNWLIGPALMFALGWFYLKLLPGIGRWALYGLLFTIVILFALQGEAITSRPWEVARIALPLLVYFALMWGGGFALGAGPRLGYARTTTLAFTAAGTNFEPAVAVAAYGATAGQALAGVVGPLVEVPALIGLVYVWLALRRRFGAAGLPDGARAADRL